MRNHLLAMTGAVALGLATVASGTVSAGTIQPVPGLGSADSGVIYIQKGDREEGRRSNRSDNRSGEGRDFQRQDSSSNRNVDRSPVVRIERQVEHRAVRRGWSRDRKHAFYGAVLLGVPFGYTTYASHPCYEWLVGPQGPGYYWNYGRCPV
jgi:hypothetical protein